MDENKYAKTVLCNCLTAKRYYLDMIRDLSELVKLRKELFKVQMTKTVQFDLDVFINKLSFYDKKPKNKNRIYVISSYRYIDLIAIDLPDEFAENILFGIKNELDQYDELNINFVKPELVSTIYIYRYSKIIYSQHIYPEHLAWILNSLKNENLIDDSLHERWTFNFD